MAGFYEIKREQNGIYRIGSKENVFMDLIVGKEKALLFDTGFGFGNLRETILEITELPLVVVNSHGHLDHACGNYQFQEPVYIHERDMELCLQTNSARVRAEAVDTGKHRIQRDTGKTENILPQGFDEQAYIRQGAGNLKPVAEGDIFDLGGITLKVIELPGHTRGSIGLYSKEKKLLYVGDAVNQALWLFAPEADNLDAYIYTLKKVKDIDFREMYTGHNPKAGTKENLEWYLDCAEHLDYTKGFPFESPFSSMQTDGVRICTREGYTPGDMRKPGFASIVISREHI